jgi:hypothetical protein
MPSGVGEPTGGAVRNALKCPAQLIPLAFLLAAVMGTVVGVKRAGWDFI